MSDTIEVPFHLTIPDDGAQPERKQIKADPSSITPTGPQITNTSIKVETPPPVHLGPVGSSSPPSSPDSYQGDLDIATKFVLHLRLNYLNQGYMAVCRKTSDLLVVYINPDSMPNIRRITPCAESEIQVYQEPDRPNIWTFRFINCGPWAARSEPKKGGGWRWVEDVEFHAIYHGDDEKARWNRGVWDLFLDRLRELVGQEAFRPGTEDMKPLVEVKSRDSLKVELQRGTLAVGLAE